MSDKPKSILDGVPVDDKAFPLNKPPVRRTTQVGNCPACGNPIYAPTECRSDEQIPVQRTCVCNFNTPVGQRRTT